MSSGEISAAADSEGGGRWAGCVVAWRPPDVAEGRIWCLGRTLYFAARMGEQEGVFKQLGGVFCCDARA
jgi:hypothetical protein